MWEAAHLAVVPALDAAQRAAVAEQACACVCDVGGAGVLRAKAGARAKSGERERR